MHVILEYKQGEILGEYVAPASSRFIISHDQFRLKNNFLLNFFLIFLVEALW